MFSDIKCPTAFVLFYGAGGGWGDGMHPFIKIAQITEEPRYKNSTNLKIAHPLIPLEGAEIRRVRVVGGKLPCS